MNVSFLLSEIKFNKSNLPNGNILSEIRISLIVNKPPHVRAVTSLL